MDDRWQRLSDEEREVYDNPEAVRTLASFSFNAHVWLCICLRTWAEQTFPDGLKSTNLIRISHSYLKPARTHTLERQPVHAGRFLQVRTCMHALNTCRLHGCMHIHIRRCTTSPGSGAYSGERLHGILWSTVRSEARLSSSCEATCACSTMVMPRTGTQTCLVCSRTARSSATRMVRFAKRVPRHLG